MTEAALSPSADRIRAGRQPPTICILALSAIADDPRVRRQAEAFHRAGWAVVAVGLPGARSSAPEWPILTRDGLRPMPAAIEIATPAVAADPAPAAAPVAPPPTDDRPPETRDIEPVPIGPVPRTRAIRRWLLRQFRNARRFSPATEMQWQILEMRIKRSIGRAHAFVVRLPGRCVAHIRRGIALIVLFVLRLPRRMCSTLQHRLPDRVLRLLGQGVLRGDFGEMRYRLRQLAVRVRPASAQELYWSLGSNILDIYACARQVDAAVWLANDWNMLPVAARLATAKGGVYGYDTHEFAAEEYAEKWRWRLWQKPLVCAIERRFIAEAAVVSAVSAGIGERLAAMYRLKRPALVVRNMPAYEHCAFRPTGERVRVLYHGIVAVGRGLEAAIDSVALWRPEFDLTIRGPENPGYSDMLRRRIRDAGLEQRARLVPPVPMTALVSEAAAFDIGFFALPGHSRHNEFALPNKFFEYVMAGLALCVSDLPEMARLVDQYRLGALIPGLDPAAIAGAVNGLDRERIDTAKRNALAAAEALCWERESARLIEAYSRLLPQAAVSG